MFNSALGPCPPPPACGNGVLEGIEQCDDSNTVDGDGCDANCTPTACGNGIKTTGEICDDGDAQDGDGCDSNCTPTACGNSIQTLGEECDLGSANGTTGAPCRANCTIPPPPGCGDGKKDDGEQCDDGANANPCDGCSDACLTTGLRQRQPRSPAASSATTRTPRPATGARPRARPRLTIHPARRSSSGG